MTTETHFIDDGTPLGDIITSLKALLAAGRGDELVEFNGELKAGLPMNGPVHFVYPILLKFAHERLRESIAGTGEQVEKLKWAFSTANRELVANLDPIKPENEADLQVWLNETGAKALHLRRELQASGEFPEEVELLNDQLAEIASMVQEPLDQPGSGAGKLRVLDERRLARDVNEIRDLPLREKMAQLVDAKDRKTFQQVNADAKGMIKSITGKPLLKVVEDMLDAEYPELMRAFYPRVYENTGRYHSPRAMAAMMANVVAEMLRYGYHRSATAYRLMMPGLAYMRQHRMPMFFVAPDLLQAVQLTDFDDDIDWTSLELPYESGALMLPKGALVHPQDGEVAMILWARIKRGDQPAPWPGIPISVLPNDSFVLLGACPETMIWYDSILTANVRPTMRLHNLFYRAPGESAPRVTKSNFMDDDLSEVDSEFVEKMGVILFGTFLAMDARPQLVEKGKLIKRVGKGEKAREFWSPNVIGGKYKLKREVPKISDRQFVAGQRATGTHASPRMHWRRGHHRNQPVGHQRKERKRIWIEPCLIGAEA